MATPLPYHLMANNTTQIQEPNKKTHIQSAPPKQEPSTRGRKPLKSQQQQQQQPRKKVPQRGMGVAQLERLRLQERFKNLQETNKFEPFSTIQPSHFSLPDPIHSFPVRYSLNCNHGGFFSTCHNQGQVVKLIDNNNSNSNSNGSSHLGGFVVNPCAFGARDVKVGVGNDSCASVFENSKELSSMPKIQQHYEHITPTSDFGFKKKRFNEENNGKKDQKLAEITPLNVCDFIGPNLENNIDLNYHPTGFGARAARSAFYANHQNFSEGAEVLTIRRKGNYPNGGNVFMEYDFFPGRSSSSTGKSISTSTCFKEMEFPCAEGSVAVVGSGEASCLTLSDYNYNASNASSSNSIDLSLKLSY